MAHLEVGELAHGKKRPFDVRAAERDMRRRWDRLLTISRRRYQAVDEKREEDAEALLAMLLEHEEKMDDAEAWLACTSGMPSVH